VWKLSDCWSRRSGGRWRVRPDVKVSFECREGAYTRSQGLLLDNMLSAEVVLADGRSVMTSRVRHPDLYWVSLAPSDPLIPGNKRRRIFIRYSSLLCIPYPPRTGNGHLLRAHPSPSGPSIDRGIGRKSYKSLPGFPGVWHDSPIEAWNELARYARGRWERGIWY